MPDYSIEDELIKSGYTNVAGIDEAGRGPLAGPVIAAAVILPKDFPDIGLNDSKRLKVPTILVLIKSAGPTIDRST